jgi:hypothetical protein
VKLAVKKPRGQIDHLDDGMPTETKVASEIEVCRHVTCKGAHLLKILIDINKIMQSLVVIVSSALKNRGLQRWSATEAPPFRVGNVPAGRL